MSVVCGYVKETFSFPTNTLANIINVCHAAHMFYGLLKMLLIFLPSKNIII